MSYKNIECILPKSLVEEIQKYVDGQLIYIPKCGQKRRAWGTRNKTRQVLDARNRQIYEAYQEGGSMEALAKAYFLSEKSIQRIVYELKASSL